MRTRRGSPAAPPIRRERCSRRAPSTARESPGAPRRARSAPSIENASSPDGWMISSRNVHGAPSSQASGTSSPAGCGRTRRKRAARLDDQRQRPIEQRPRQPERCAARACMEMPSTGPPPRSASAESPDRPRSGSCIDLGYRDAGCLRLAPLAVLVALPRLQIEREPLARHRRGAVDHVDELRVGEARRRRAASASFRRARELAEKLLPGARARAPSRGLAPFG